MFDLFAATFIPALHGITKQAHGSDAYGQSCPQAFHRKDRVLDIGGNASHEPSSGPFVPRAHIFSLIASHARGVRYEIVPDSFPDYYSQSILSIKVGRWLHSLTVVVVFRCPLAMSIMRPISPRVSINFTKS